MNRLDSKYQALIRRQYLINPAFQIRFILYTVGVALFAVIAVYLTSNYFFWSFQEKGREIGLAEGHVFFTFLDQQQAYMNRLLLGLAGLFVLGLSFWGLILSHRVAGPLHRLHNHMWQVARGEVTTPLNFREKDFFQDLTNAYNAQLDYLKNGGAEYKASPADSHHSHAHEQNRDQAS